MDAKGFLVDVDGVLTFGGEALPGAREAAAWLRERYPVRFLTNTSRKSSFSLLRELGEAGFDVSREEVFTAPMAAASHLRERGAESVCLLTTEDLARDFAEFDVVEEGADAVVVGDMGRGFDYDILNTGFRCLMEGAELVAIHENRFWDDGSGLRLDAGPFVAALEYAADAEAAVVGKPSPEFFGAALRDLGLEPGDAAMVGDDVYADIRGAAGAGLDTVLVRQGKYRPGVLEESGVDPEVAVDGLLGLVELLRSEG